MNKALVAYHGKCIDGFTSAWIADRALRKKGYEVELLPMYYNEESYESLKAEIGMWDPDRLYVVDFSLPVDFLEVLKSFNSRTEVTILDHHKTAFENYSLDIHWTDDSKLMTTIHGANIILDMTKSGAGICWHYFNKEEYVPDLVRYVQDYDLYLFKDGDRTRWVNKYLREQEFTLGSWDAVNDLMNTVRGLSKVLVVGKELQEAHDHAVDIIVVRAEPCCIASCMGLLVHCLPKFASSVGHILAEKCGSYGLMYSVHEKSNTVRWSLRSIDDFDVSVLAKAYGGGGHKNAAGFETELLGATELLAVGVSHDG